MDMGKARVAAALEESATLLELQIPIREEGHFPERKQL